jgi:hypothetical protein
MNENEGVSFKKDREVQKAVRKEINTRVKRDVEAKFEERKQSVDYTSAEPEVRLNVDIVIDHVKNAKGANPEKGYYELIKDELGKVDRSGLSATEARGMLHVRYLQEVRRVLIDQAKALGVLDKLKEDINGLDNLQDKGKILKKLQKFKIDAKQEKYGREITKITDKNEEEPLNDLKGVTTDYVEVAELVYRLAFKQAELKAAGLNPVNAETKAMERKISLYGWGDPVAEHPDVFWNAENIVSKNIREEEERKLRLKSLEYRSEFTQTSQLPRGIGAAFMGSISENMARQTGTPEGHIVKVLSLVKEEGGETVADADNIKEWMNKNLHAFLTRGVAPEKTWKAHMAHWIGSDLMAALRVQELKLLHGKSGKELVEATRQFRNLEKEILETKNELVRRMAVHAAVEAQKASGGSHTAYGIYMVGDDGRGDVNLDALDLSDAPDLIEDNASFYDQVLNGDKNKKDKTGKFLNTKEGAKEKERVERVQKDYKDLKVAMGLGNEKDLVEVEIIGNKVNRVSQIRRVDIKALTDEETGIFKYFGEHDGKKGFERWIEARLDAEDKKNEDEFQKTGTRPLLPSREERWLAAKTAADLFMVDGKYTKWRAKLAEAGIDKIEKNGQTYTEKEKFTEEEMHERGIKRLFKMDPFKTWGGDPLASIEFGPTLQHKIKGTYNTKDGKRMMKEIANGLSLRHLLADEEGETLVQISSVGSTFKRQVRYNRAINKFFGGSKGQGIADWGRDGFQGVRDMMNITDDYLDGNREYRLKDGGYITKQQIEGLQVAILLHVKAEAKIRESREPGLGERLFRPLRMEIEDPKSRPNTEALQSLLGPNMDGTSGYITELMGDRLGVKFQPEARRLLRETIDMLDSNDQNDFWRSLSKLLSYVGLGMGIAAILAKYGLEVSGIEIPSHSGGKRK